MRVYEIRLKVFLLKDIYLSQMQEKCAALIDKALLDDPSMQIFHEQKIYKNYCAAGLHPIESDGVYKSGKIYTLMLRTIDEKLKDYFMYVLKNTTTEEMKGLIAVERPIKKIPLQKIYSLSPVIIKNPEGYWRNCMTLDAYERRLFENLVKKYKCFTGKVIDENFDLYTSLQINNEGPIVCKYKNIKLLGDKLTLEISNDVLAQELSYMALGTGIGEGNARGYGFLGYKYL